MREIRECFHIALPELYKRRLGVRGAELVEYALVIACVVAVCAVVYTVNSGTFGADFRVSLLHLWENIGYSIKSAF